AAVRAVMRDATVTRPAGGRWNRARLWRKKPTGENAVWLMQGSETATMAFVATIGDPNWEIKGIGDFDGDGAADAIWRNKASGQSIVWLMNGTAITLAAFLPTIADTNWDIVAVGD